MPTNAQQIIALASRRITLDAEWDEAKHKRNHGQFSSGGGSSGGGKTKASAPDQSHLYAKRFDDPERKAAEQPPLRNGRPRLKAMSLHAPSESSAERMKKINPEHFSTPEHVKEYAKNKREPTANYGQPHHWASRDNASKLGYAHAWEKKTIKNNPYPKGTNEHRDYINGHKKRYDSSRSGPGA